MLTISLLKIPGISQTTGFLKFVLHLKCDTNSTAKYTCAVGLLLYFRGSFPSPEPHISLTTDSQMKGRKQNGKAWCTAGTA